MYNGSLSLLIRLCSPITSKIGDGQVFVECCLWEASGVHTKEGWPLWIRCVGKQTTSGDNPPCKTDML